MAAPEDTQHSDGPLLPPTAHYHHHHHQHKGQRKAAGETAVQVRRDARGCWGARHTVALLALLGIFLDYMIQAILAVPMVAMVGQDTAGMEGKGDVCPLPGGHNSTEVSKRGEFDWDERTQGIIQGALNIGCALVSLPGGRIAEVCGGTRSFGLMLLCASVLVLVSPVAAYSSIWLFIVVRVLQGVAVGSMFPALNIILVAWFPPEERSKFLSIILTGMNLGSVTCMALAGWLCGLDWLGGWPAPFYVVGGAGVVWSALWFPLVHATPQQHPRINKKEMHYILGGGKRGKEEEVKRFPWGPFLRSPAVWIQSLTPMGDAFSLYIIMTMVPTYLTNIQHFSLQNAGVIAALPHLLSAFVSVGWGCAVGRLTAAHALSKRHIKQLSTVMGFYIPAVCMLGMCLVGCNKDAAVALLILCVCANTCNFAGYFSSYQDLSPTYCGTFMGFAGIFTSTSGVLGPFVTGLMINDTQTLGAWRNVFVTSALVYIVACTFYLVFTPVRQQPWDNASSLTPSASSSSLSSPSCPLCSPAELAKTVGREGVKV